LAELSNGTSPTATFGAAPTARHKVSRFKSDPSERPHCLRETASVACRRSHTEQVKQRNRTYARYIGGHATLNYPSPRVGILLLQLGAQLAHSLKQGHGHGRASMSGKHRHRFLDDLPLAVSGAFCLSAASPCLRNSAFVWLRPSRRSQWTRRLRIARRPFHDCRVRSHEGAGGRCG